jgi:threonine synthase
MIQKNTKLPGKTPLSKSKNLEETTGFANVFIKDESKNPFGTVKDRRNYAIFQEANRLKVDKLVLITSGNNGYSLAQFAKKSLVKIVCIVSKNLPNTIKRTLQNHAYQVLELNLEHKILRPEELIAFAREKEDEVIWEVTNGYEENYTGIVDEILEEIPPPNYIVVPVGSGGIFLGIIQGLELRGLATKVIGIGSQNTTHSFADKLSTPWTPYSRALEHYAKQGHEVYRLTEQEIKDAYNKYKNLVACEPSSSVVFAALQKHPFKSTDTIVLLNSGKAVVQG